MHFGTTTFLRSGLRTAGSVVVGVILCAIACAQNTSPAQSSPLRRRPLPHGIQTTVRRGQPCRRLSRNHPANNRGTRNRRGQDQQSPITAEKCG